MTIDQAIKIAPSIGAKNPHWMVSDRYSFLPTTETLEILNNRGWEITSVQERGILKSDRKGFQKHIVRLAHDSVPELAPQDRFELVVTNSHDRSARHQIMGGVFRLVCMNGLVMSTSTFASLVVTHIYVDKKRIAEYADNAAEFGANISSHITRMRERELKETEKLSFAETVMLERYGEHRGSWPVMPVKLLEPRREVDRGNSLWAVYNVLQENVVRGGQWDSRLDANGRPYMPTKEITNLDRVLGLNMFMWAEAEKLLAKN